MFTLQSAPAVVNPAPMLPGFVVAPVATFDEESRLEADYREYSEWLDANAAELAGMSDAYDMMEQGYQAW